jgi:hypothetical protein
MNDRGAGGDTSEVVRIQSIPFPDECKNHHTEMFEVDGVMYPANTCARCNKWFPPYMTGVPADQAENYCWGHQIEDAIAPWKQVVVDLVCSWEAYDSTGENAETWEADMDEAVKDAKRLLDG